MTKEYRDSRKPFTPEVGGLYENEGGGIFRCLYVFEQLYKNAATMRNERSGWTFEAHGIGVYKDGRIDWDYSTGGQFCDEIGNPM